MLKLMVRGIFFDFYSVWTPDKIQDLLNQAEQQVPQDSETLAGYVERYYHGQIDRSQLANAFSSELRRSDITAGYLTLNDSDIAPAVSNLMRGLHGHFVKLGVLGNLGTMELDLLNKFNAKESLFEVVMSPLSIGSQSPLFSEEIFVKALQAIGEPPASCLLISGHEDYLDFADSFGMQTLKFAGLTNLRTSLADLLAKDIPSFVGPNEIAPQQPRA
jgi:FMN phosphatase YigB (HAD superfamily)